MGIMMPVEEDDAKTTECRPGCDSKASWEIIGGGKTLGISCSPCLTKVLNEVVNGRLSVIIRPLRG